MLDLVRALLWPLLASLLLPPVLIQGGLQTLRRRQILPALALPQIAALGYELAALKEQQETWVGLGCAVGLTFLAVMVFSVGRLMRRAEISGEAYFAVVYVLAAGVVVHLLSRTAEGGEGLRTVLVGNLLLVNQTTVLRSLGIYAGIAVLQFLLRRRFEPRWEADGQTVAMDAEAVVWDGVFYSLLGVAMSVFVPIGGVLVSFAYAIVPAVCAMLLSGKGAVRLVLGWLIAAAASVFSLYLSYRADLPMGETVIAALAGAAVVCFLLRALVRRGRSLQATGV